MTENIVDKLRYDWHKLELAEVAGEYLDQGKEGLPLAKKSLELLLGDIEYDDPAIVKTITNDQVIPITLKNQLDTYYQGYNAQTVDNLIDYHGGTIEKYLEGDSGKVKEKLTPVLGMKYSDIKKQIKKAGHILEGDENKLEANTKEEVKEAEETMKKYGLAYYTIMNLEQRRKSELRSRVEDAASKDFFINNYLKEPQEGDAE